MGFVEFKQKGGKTEHKTHLSWKKKRESEAEHKMHLLKKEKMGVHEMEHTNQVKIL